MTNVTTIGTPKSTDTSEVAPRKQTNFRLVLTFGIVVMNGRPFACLYWRKIPAVWLAEKTNQGK